MQRHTGGLKQSFNEHLGRVASSPCALGFILCPPCALVSRADKARAVERRHSPCRNHLKQKLKKVKCHVMKNISSVPLALVMNLWSQTDLEPLQKNKCLLVGMLFRYSPAYSTQQAAFFACLCYESHLHNCSGPRTKLYTTAWAQVGRETW